MRTSARADVLTGVHGCCDLTLEHADRHIANLYGATATGSIIQAHGCMVCRCTAHLKAETDRLQQRLVAVNGELDTLRQASAASAAAAERQLQRSSAQSQAELQAAQQQVYAATQELRQEEAKVQEQLVVLSNEHAREVATIKEEGARQLACAQAEVQQRSGVIVASFRTAAQSFSVVEQLVRCCSAAFLRRKCSCAALRTAQGKMQSSVCSAIACACFQLNWNPASA